MAKERRRIPLNMEIDESDHALIVSSIHEGVTVEKMAEFFDTSPQNMCTYLIVHGLWEEAAQGLPVVRMAHVRDGRADLSKVNFIRMAHGVKPQVIMPWDEYVALRDK